jgi:hypothetical protein
MTALEIIDEIKHLPPGEQEKVAGFVSALGGTKKLTPAELTDLAGKLVEENDPVKAETLKEQIIAGFYGDERQDA